MRRTILYRAISLGAVLIFLFTASSLPALAIRDFIIENATSPLFIVNGTTGDIALAPVFGRVGVGTAVPLTRLDIRGPGSDNTVSNIVQIVGTFANGVNSGISGLVVNPTLQGGGASQSLHGAYINPVFWKANNPQAAYGIFINTSLSIPSGSEEIGTVYGLYLRPQSAGNQNYPLYSEGGVTFFGGIMRVNTSRINTSLPNYALEVGSGTDGKSVNLSGVMYVNGTNRSVGIGTASPMDPLQIHTAAVEQGERIAFSIGSSDFGSGAGDAESIAWRLYGGPTVAGKIQAIWTPGAMGFGFHTWNGALQESVRITGSGNVGIGTTNPNDILEVIGNVRVSGSLNATNINSSRFYARNGTVSAPQYTFIEDTDTGISHNAGAGNNISIVTGGSARLSIDGYGNVGIGTTNPSAPFVVSAAPNGGYLSKFTVTDTGNANVRLERTGGTTAGWEFYLPSGSQDLRVFDSVDDTITFQRGGNVGIGTTSPGEKLHISGASAEIRLNDTDDPNFWDIGPSGDDFKIALNDSTSDGVFIDQDGNVGIGTTVPGTKLDIRGAQAQLLGDSALFRIQDSGGQAWYLRTQNNDGSFIIQDETAGRTVMSLETNGNVGINTSSPSQTLEVVGTLNVKSGQSGNAQGLFQNAAGNVGIGTASPSDKLHVSGSGNTAIFVTRTDATANTGYLQAVSGQTNIGNIAGDISFQPGDANTVTFKSGGRVGIGETLPGSMLSVSGSGSFGSGYDSTAAPTNGLIVEGNVGIGTTNPTDKLDVNGNTTIRGNLTVGSSALFVNASGRVGIGTGAPSERLTITGAGNEDNFILFQEGTNNRGIIGWDQSKLAFTINYGGNANDDAITIDTVPNVGINTLPYNTLTVGGSASVSGSLNASSINTTGNAYFATSSGNVGIGTTSPSEKLDIVGNIELDSTDATRKLVSVGGGLNVETPANEIMYLDAGGDFRFRDQDDSDAIRVVIQSGSGNVGIGTTTPNYLLQTASGTDGRSVNLSGVLYVNGSSGNVGIGTTNPNSTLDVRSSDGNAIQIGIGSSNGTAGYYVSTVRSQPFLRFAGFNLGHLAFRGTADGYATEQTGADIYSLTEGDGTNTWQSAPAANIIFATTPNTPDATLTDRMIIKAAGNIGINTTSPAQTLTLQGTMNVTPAGQGGRPALFVASNGNVGVGTAIPNESLELVGNLRFSGGSRFIQTPNTTAATETSSSLTIKTGDASTVTTSGGSGSISIKTGDTGNALPSGAIVIQAGTVGGGVGPGGDVNITAGSSSGGGSIGGNVVINPGSGNVGNNGDVVIANLRGNVGVGLSDPNSTLQVSGGVRITLI